MNRPRVFRMREASAASSAAALERPGTSPETETCPTCNGTGKVGDGDTCPTCDGSGKVPAGSVKEAAPHYLPDFEDLREVAAVASNWTEDGSLRAAVVEKVSEKDYSTDARVAFAKEGKAIPIRDDEGEVTGGAYPIDDRADLEDAVKSFGRDPTDQTKAHITKRARALGATDLLPDDWSASTKEAGDLADRLARIEGRLRVFDSLRESKPGTLTDTYSTLSRVQASDGQEGYKVILIREGRGNSDDNRWYTADAIKEMCESGVAEGMQAYADHPDLEEEELRPERSVKQLVGHYRDVRFAESGGVPRAEAVFVPLTLNEEHPTYGWVVTLAEAAAKSAGPQPLCGISLYGFSAGDYGPRPDGSEGMIATLIRPASGDIVTNAGAGGGFVRRLMESARALRNRSRTKENQPMQIKDYQSKVREAVKRVREADSDDVRAAALTDLEALQEQAIDAPPKPVDTVEALTESAPKLVEEIRESAKADASRDLEAENKKLRETLGKFNDVVSLTGTLREAGVTDEVEMRYFVGQAQSRNLHEADAIKAMVTAEREMEARRAEKLRESLNLDDLPEVEGAGFRAPAAAPDGGLEVLRESGIPVRTAA